MWQANWRGTWDAFRHLQRRLFKHLQDLDFAFHSNKSSGAIMSILKQGEAAYVNMGIDFHFRIFPIVLEIIIVTYFLSGISLGISGIFFVFMMIYLAFITWFGWSQNNARRKLRQASYRMDSIQVENLTNFDTVKFFSQEQAEEVKYAHASHTYRKVERPYINRYLILQIGTSLLLATMTFLCFSVAISEYFKGILSVGDISSIVALISVLLPSLLAIANEWRNVTKYLTDLEPYFELLETPNTVIDNPISEKQSMWESMNSQITYDIRFTDVTFHYPDREPIFDNLSLQFEAGKSYGIVGKS